MLQSRASRSKGFENIMVRCAGRKSEKSVRGVIAIKASSQPLKNREQGPALLSSFVVAELLGVLLDQVGGRLEHAFAVHALTSHLSNPSVVKCIRGFLPFFQFSFGDDADFLVG